MSEFGKLGWGTGSFGTASPAGQSAATTEAEQKTSSSGSELGDPTTALSSAHARALVKTYGPTVGLPAANEHILKKKSWAPTFDIFSRELNFDFSNLGVVIRIRFMGSADLSASILAFGAIQEGDPQDLTASLQPHHLDDFVAALITVPGVDLGGVFQPIPGWDLPTALVTIPSVNLGAIGGGHFPEDIPALLAAVPPVDLPAEIRGGFSDTLDLTGALTQIGAFQGLQGIVRAAIPSLADLQARIGVISQGVVDLPATLQPYRSVDLGAAIETQRVFGVRALIYGYARLVTEDITAYLRRVDSVVEDFPVVPLKAVVSTHTSDKLPNLTKVARSFFNNRYVFGTVGAGLVVLNLQPVFGVFPDLHAEIIGRDFFRSNITGFVRAAIRDNKGLGSVVTSVVQFTNVRRLLLDLIPLINMEGDLIQVGGFLPVRGSIASVHRGQTTTADDAGFVTTASTYRFLLGTTQGLFIPPQAVSQIRVTTFRNVTSLPDLHATIEGWHEADLTASLSSYPFSALAASATALGVDHLSHLTAFLAAFKAADLGASLTRSGGFEPFGGSITAAGKVEDLSASVVSSIDPLAFNVVSVSTKPALNLGALINYGSLVSCSPTSVISEIGAYIKTIVTGTPETIQSLSAELNVLRVEEDFTADIVGRRRTRVRILSLTFRSKTRDSGRIRGSITPVIPTVSSVSAEIVGLLHEANLLASLTPVRFATLNGSFTTTEQVVNLNTGEVKSVLISFRSQVNLYVYEEVTTAVYATDRGTWAIDVRSLIREDSFFDRPASNREVKVDAGLQEFYSLDEAIRNAIVLLCERQQSEMAASLSARGAIADLGVQISTIAADRVGDLNTSLVSVLNSPDITASISGARSSLIGVTATLVAGVSQVSGNIGGSVSGNIVNDLGAEITVS